MNATEKIFLTILLNAESRGQYLGSIAETSLLGSGSLVGFKDILNQ